MRIRLHAGVTALLLAIAAPLTGQQQPQAPRPNGPAGAGPRGLNVELALRQKEQLKLNESQVSQLDAIRREIVAERQERARQMIDIQSRLAAGLVKPEDVRDQLQGKRGDIQKVMEQRHDRIAKILTQDQQDQLRRAERRMMVQRVRRGGMQGFRGGFGPRFGPGFGPQFGPGFGQQFRPGFGPQFGPGLGPQPFPRGQWRPWWDEEQN